MLSRIFLKPSRRHTNAELQVEYRNRNVARCSQVGLVGRLEGIGAYQAAADSGAGRTGALCDSMRGFLPPLKAGVCERAKNKSVSTFSAANKNGPNRILSISHPRHGWSYNGVNGPQESTIFSPFSTILNHCKPFSVRTIGTAFLHYDL